jgi:hypothetical protein
VQAKVPWDELTSKAQQFSGSTKIPPSLIVL